MILAPSFHSKRLNMSDNKLVQRLLGQFHPDLTSSGRGGLDIFLTQKIQAKVCKKMDNDPPPVSPRRGMVSCWVEQAVTESDHATQELEVPKCETLLEDEHELLRIVIKYMQDPKVNPFRGVVPPSNPSNLNGL